MIVTILQILLIIYFGISTLYIFTIATASLFGRKNKSLKDQKLRKFVILIPGFKEDNVIVDTARDALTQDYPVDKFEVVVIADSFLQQTIEELKKLPVRVVEVSFENSTKSKSINKALEILPENYDITLILDADNLMENSFLSKINNVFSRGYICVQGHRIAKNMETSMAILDAISEEINNSLFRKGHRVLRLSAALIGSGMAFDFHYYKNVMKNIDAIGGFDKELELILIKEGVTLEYCEDAMIYDEKVSSVHQFSKQRRRWMSAQWIYFRRSFSSLFSELFIHGNIDYFIKAVQFSFPPRSLMLVFLFCAMVASFFFNSLEFTFIWTTLFMLAFLSILFATPRYFYNKATLLALFTLPRSIIIMFLTLFRLRGANKQFLHTEHGKKEK